MGAWQDFNAAVLRARRIVFPDVIEMGELGADAAEIVPDARENGFDLLRRFFRESGAQIGAADLLFAQRRTDPTGDAAEHVGGFDRIEIAGGAQHADGQAADCGFAERFGRIAHTGFRSGEQRMHREGAYAG